MENGQTKGFYDFGEFRLDVRNRLLWRAGKTVALTLKEFEILLFFIENAGRVIEKEVLLSAVWKDTFIEEGTLTQHISRLRRKLEAAVPNGEILIETLPRRGYRFLPEVLKIEENALVIEEQISQQVHIEERVKIAPSLINAESITVREAVSEAEIPLVYAPSSKLLPAPATKRGYSYLWLFFGFLALTVTCFAAIYFYNPEPRTIPVERVVPFSGLPGREAMPAFSPDGKQLAFSWNGGEQDGSFDIYVKIIGAGNPVRLTGNQADDVRPTFAPDGRTLAFVRVLPTHSAVFSIPALGGAERKICDLRRSFSSISFSPDGRFLAVYDGDENNRAGIFTVNIETGEKKRLTAPPELANDDRPAFAPDGQRIAFIRGFAQNVQEIYIIPAGGEPRQLTFDKAWIGGMAWSADGKRIVFASRRKYKGRANLWQVEAAGGEQPELITTGSERLGNLAVSPDNRTIAFVEESYDTNIWRIELAKASESAAFRKFAPSSRSDNSPTVSPDGSRVVFASSRTGKYEIWIADADGANARQLTDLPKAQSGSPRFSPDGNWIVFDAQIEGNGDIFVVSTNGGAIRRLTESSAFDYIPAWSADGSSIYFASNRSGAAQIYKITAAGGEARQITRNGGEESYESPDGKYLYYRKSEGKGGLWRTASEGGEEKSVPELTEAGYWRYWTVSKTGIYFVQRSEYPPYKIMFYDFSGSQIREIAATDASPISVYPGLGVSEDGKRILYAQNDQSTSSIMLAEIGN